MILEFSEGRESRRESHLIDTQDPVERAACLKKWKVEVLLCAGISQALALHVRSAGVSVVSGANGMLRDALKSFLNGESAAAD